MLRRALLLLAAAPLAAAAQASLSVERGVGVRPDTVTIGDPFAVIVRVRAPSGTTIEFPDRPDSSAVEALDSPVIRPASAAGDAVEQSAVYRLAAWDVGSQPIVLGDIVVRRGEAERRIPFGELAVFVKSVLPADTAQRVPKPARDLFVFGWPWWYWVLIALAAATLIGLLVWWWRRRRRAREGGAIVDPYERAQREFDRVVRLGLLEAGERGRYVALMVEVLREYLAARYTGAPLSSTTSEVVAALRGEARISIERIATLLGEADLIKFARRAVSPERAKTMGEQARQLVKLIEETYHAPSDADRPKKAA